MIKVQDRAEFIGQVIDIFEDFLAEKGIEIDNPEKENDEDAAIIYGCDYGDLQSSLEEIMINWGLFEDDNTTRNNAYYELVNMIDTIALEKREPLCSEVKTISSIANKNEINISDFAGANDCNNCKTWGEIIKEFQRLWEEGKRVKLKVKTFL